MVSIMFLDNSDIPFGQSKVPKVFFLKCARFKKILDPTLCEDKFFRRIFHMVLKMLLTFLGQPD